MANKRHGSLQRGTTSKSNNHKLEPSITLTVEALQELLTLQIGTPHGSRAAVTPRSSDHPHPEVIANRNILKEVLHEITKIRSDLHHMGENLNFLVTTNLEILQMMREIRQQLATNGLSTANAVNASLAVLGGSTPL